MAGRLDEDTTSPVGGFWYKSRKSETMTADAISLEPLEVAALTPYWRTLRSTQADRWWWSGDQFGESS